MTTHSEPSGQPDAAATAQAAPAARARTAAPAFATVTSTRFTVFVSLFVGVMMISTITATKSTVFFPDFGFTLGALQVQGIVMDGAFFLFPLAYILGDVIAEVYGYRAMRKVVAIGFALLLLMVVCFQIAIALPTPDFYENQAALEAITGVVPRIFLASLAGYVVGELLNAAALVRLKSYTGEAKLWVRLLGSTVVGQAADTLIFCSIAATAIGISTWGDFLNYVVIGFVWKTGIEAVVLPITYRVVAWTKRNEPSYQTALAA